MLTLFKIVVLFALCLFTPGFLIWIAENVLAALGELADPGTTKERLQSLLIGVPSLMLGWVMAVILHRRIFPYETSTTVWFLRRIPLSLARMLMAATLVATLAITAIVTGDLPHGGGMAAQMLITMWMPTAAVLALAAELFAAYHGFRSEPTRWAIAMTVGILTAIPLAVSLQSSGM